MGTSHAPIFLHWYVRNRKGDLKPVPSAHPWAWCLTEILFCGVGFERFSWCFKSGDFRMNGIAVYKNSRILLLRMEKISCYFNILLVYLFEFVSCSCSTNIVKSTPSCPAQRRTLYTSPHHPFRRIHSQGWVRGSDRDPHGLLTCQREKPSRSKGNSLFYIKGL